MPHSKCFAYVIIQFNYIISSDLSSSLISSFSFCLFLCLRDVEEKEEKLVNSVIIASFYGDWILALFPPDLVVKDLEILP